MPASAAEPLYLDACATAPTALAVLEAMAIAQQRAWANPSSLHGFGLEAAEQLERARCSLAQGLGCPPDWITFCSGGTEAAALALCGAAGALAPGRLVISAVEHPAVGVAAEQLQQQGWELTLWPVDRSGRVDLTLIDQLLAPPTRLVSVIWGQSEVGSLNPVQEIGEACRRQGVLFHTDAVQVIGHQQLALGQMPIDLLSCTAHKLQGPRGIGAVVANPRLALRPLLPGGGQEAGRRGGTESVVLASGFAAALEQRQRLLLQSGGRDPQQELRDQLMQRLLALPGVRLSGHAQQRLPHHLSLLISDRQGHPLPGRRLVQQLWKQGLAVASGTACSSGASAPSPVLQAMGYSPAEASSGIRISLGPWLEPEQMLGLPDRLEAALRQVQEQLSASAS